MEYGPLKTLGLDEGEKLCPQALPVGAAHKLPAYAWPGGYPILYLDREDSTLCPECAQRSLDDEDEVPQFKPRTWFIYWEGPPMYCDQCGKELESAYGPTDEDTEDDE